MVTVYIAARDIGNYKDNTERLKEILIESDIILVESFREATTLFKALDIKKDRECLIEFSEHTKKAKDIDEIITKIINCKTVSLISDCGTPVLEDPGRLLIEYCYSHNIRVRPVAGVSSVTAAIMCLPFNFKEFYYAGLLPRDDREREKIFEIHIGKKRKTDLKNIDIRKIVEKTKGYCGADIESVVYDSLEDAFVQKKDCLSTEDILNAINNTHSISETMKDSLERMAKNYKERKFKSASN